MSARRIVVTGGTAGIGLAVARRLIGDGHQVFICGRDQKRLGLALESLRSDGRCAQIGGASCDVRDLQSVQAMIAAATGAMGGLDGLVNSAGTAFITDFEEISPPMWADILATNLTGVFNCCHAALPALKQAAADGGVADIVNVGSRSGRYAFRGGVGYNTTKFGLQGLTEAMFLDLSRFGIRVGLVAPGTVATGLAGVLPADWQLRPEDVGDAVSTMIAAHRSACVNWVEIRPSRPPT